MKEDKDKLKEEFPRVSVNKSAPVETLSNGFDKLEIAEQNPPSLTNGNYVNGNAENGEQLDSSTSSSTNISFSKTNELTPRMLKQQMSVDGNTPLSSDGGGERIDSTGVDVFEFLRTTLKTNQKDRAILLKFEHEMIEFINNKMVDVMRFEPMTSYHRMLVHRVAAYFGMDHNVDETGKCVIVNKIKETKIPDFRFADYINDCMTSKKNDDLRRRSILKRSNHSRSFDQSQSARNDWKDNRQRSFEEREENYEKIRARIFNNEERISEKTQITSKQNGKILTDASVSTATGTCATLTRPRSQPTITVLPRCSSLNSIDRQANNDCSTVKSSKSQPAYYANGTYTGCANQNIPVFTTDNYSPVNNVYQSVPPVTDHAPNIMPRPPITNGNDLFMHDTRQTMYNKYQYVQSSIPVTMDTQQYTPRYHEHHINRPNIMYPPPYATEGQMFVIPANHQPLLPPIYPPSINQQFPPYYHGDMMYKHDSAQSPSNMPSHQIYNASSSPYPRATSNSAPHPQQQQQLMYLPATTNRGGTPSYCVYSQFQTNPQAPRVTTQDSSNGNTRAAKHREDY